MIRRHPRLTAYVTEQACCLALRSTHYPASPRSNRIESRNRNGGEVFQQPARATSVRTGSPQPLQLIVFASIFTRPDDSMKSGFALRDRRKSSGADEIGIGQAQAEYFVACLPEHQFALGWVRKYVFDDPHML